MHALSVRALAFCLAAMSLAAPALAQTAPGVELSGGYQFLSFSVEDQKESMGTGWYVDVAGNLNPMLGIVFHVGGNYKSIDESVTAGGLTAAVDANLSVHQFLGGLRLNARSDSAIVPFAQALVGGINGSVEVNASTTIPGQPPIAFSDEESGTNFALDLGAGVNFGLSDALGIRVGVDYLRVFEEDAGANLFRFAAGIVIGR